MHKINLTGVCLIRHHINNWEQIRLTLSELDKQTDQIFIFSAGRKFDSNFSQIAHPKLTLYHFSPELNNAEILNYISRMIKKSHANLFMYMEAGECFERGLDSEVYEDYLQLIEEENVFGILFKTTHFNNAYEIALDPELPFEQIRVFKKKYFEKLHIKNGAVPKEIFKAKETIVLPSTTRIQTYGSNKIEKTLISYKKKVDHPDIAKSWIEKKDNQFYSKSKFRPFKIHQYFKLLVYRLTGLMLFRRRWYSVFQ